MDYVSMSMTYNTQHDVCSIFWFQSGGMPIIFMRYVNLIIFNSLIQMAYNLTGQLVHDITSGLKPVYMIQTSVHSGLRTGPVMVIR